SFAGREVHAVAGIGNPQRFFDLLTRAGLKVRPHPFPDHAELTAADVSFAEDWPVLMTEKDAVKCAEFAAPNHWFVPVSAAFSDADSRDLKAIVHAALDGFTLRES